MLDVRRWGARHPASMANLHSIIWPVSGRSLPLPSAVWPCTAFCHFSRPVVVSEARAGTFWLVASPLGCTLEWHEQASLSPSRSRSLTA